jgi:hypothetical protein
VSESGPVATEPAWTPCPECDSLFCVCTAADVELPDTCECGEVLAFDEDGECFECALARATDESAEHAIDDARAETEAA